MTEYHLPMEIILTFFTDLLDTIFHHDINITKKAKHDILS